MLETGMITSSTSLDFSPRLAEAGRILRLPPDELFSIKVSPFEEVNEGTRNFYLSTRDYQLLEEALSASSVAAKKLGPACHGMVWLCDLGEGIQCLYVEHETGPEVIMHMIALGAGTVAATALAANQVISLINNICKLLRSVNRRERDGKGRFMGASIEKRLSKTQRVIRQVSGTAKAAEKAIENIDELLN
jgi:hypothetical protein